MSQWFGHLVLSSMGLAAAGVLVVLIRLCWRRDPISCYRMLVVLLVAAIALPVLQLSIQGRAAGVTPAGEQLLATVWWTEHAEVATGELVTDLAADDAGAPISADEPFARSRSVQAPRASGPRVVDIEELAAEEPVSLRADTGAATSAFAGAVVDDSPSLVEPRPVVRGRDWSASPLGPWLAALWVLGVLGFGSWHAARLARTWAMIRRSRPLTSTRLLELWRWVTLGRHRRVRVVVSGEIASPACWGVLRPILMLPAHDVEHTDDDVLEWAMRHELVHIRRGDARTAAVQSVLTTLFWFHPVAWWLSAQLDRLRELSCDDLVVRGNGKRRSYALALLDYAGGRGRPIESTAPTHGALVPWSGSASQLKRRIKMLEKTRSSRGLRDRMVAWTSVATMVATLWSSQLAIAATLFPAPQEEPPPAPQAPCVCDEPGTSVEGAEAPSVEFLAPDVSFSVAPDDVAFDAPTLTYSVAPTAPTAPTFFTESVAPDAAHVLGSYARPGAIGRGAFVGSGAVCDRRIGVKLKRVGAELASHLGVSSDETLLVDAVAKGSPAAAAGVKRHDVLVSVDGHAPVTVESLRAAVRGKAVGDEIRLGLIRRGERIFVEVEVSDWRGDGLWSQPLKPGPTAIAPRLGLGAGVSKLKLPRKLAEPNIPKKLGRARGFVLPTAPRGKGRRRGSDDDEKELRRAIESLEKTRRSLQKYIDRLERELKEAERDANRPSQRHRRTRSRRVTRSTESDVETLKRRMNGRLSGAPLQADPEAASAEVDAGQRAIEAETRARVRGEYARALERLRDEAARLDAERDRLESDRDARAADAFRAQEDVEKRCKERSSMARRTYSEALKRVRRMRSTQSKRTAEINRVLQDRVKRAEKDAARERSALARELIRPAPRGGGEVQHHEHHHFHEHIHRFEHGEAKSDTTHIELSLRDLQSRLDREGRELGRARIASSVDGRITLDRALADRITSAVSAAVARRIRVSLDRDSQHIVLTMPARDEIDTVVRRCLRECAPALEAAESIVAAVRASTLDEGRQVGIAIESLTPAKRAAIDAVQTQMDVLESDLRKLAEKKAMVPDPTLLRAAEKDRKSIRLE